MFRHGFSFEQASRLAETVTNVSPTSVSADHCLHIQPARERTPPPCSIGDLAEQLFQQNLSVEVDPLYEFEASTSSTSSDTHRPTYSRLQTSILRNQRQANQRMQCSSSHVRDISRLVEMVEEQQQCVVISDSKSRTSSTSSTSTTSSSSTVDNDEATNIDYTSHAPADEPFYQLSFRRSGEPLPGCAMMNKGVRMRTRKTSKVLKRRAR